MRIRLQILATAVCVTGILLGVACKLWFPQYWFGWYPAVLVVFWLMEMVMSFVLDRYEGKMDSAGIEGRKFMRVYMISKLLKVLATLGLIALYFAFAKDDEYAHQVEFASCAIAFYLINLGVETFVVTKSRKTSKPPRD